MEYVIAKTTHPTWLTMQLPIEVARLIRFDPESEPGGTAARSISFLSRGPGLARVIATYPAREALAVETVRGRLLATARLGAPHLFTLPTAVAEHLGLKIFSRGDRVKGTDDSIAWLVPAPEYYEYRSVVESRKSWTGPSGGPFAHVYVTRSLVPFPRGFEALGELEFRIEEDEWRPAIAALQHVGRGRRASL